MESSQLCRRVLKLYVIESTPVYAFFNILLSAPAAPSSGIIRVPLVGPQTMPVKKPLILVPRANGNCYIVEMGALE
jgi:hypothetical protein